MSSPPLQHARWIAQANEHWKENQPSRYKALTSSGQLATALRQAASDTANDLQVLTDEGFSPDQAWEMVRERHLFPPEEPGASEEAPDSEGYRIARDANEALNSISMPGERMDPD